MVILDFINLRETILFFAYKEDVPFL